jgi:DNA-directed RNA polymerase subunit A"
MNVTMGLPRIIEILDGRANIKTPTMEIFLQKPYSEGKEIKEIAMKIKETTLKDISKEFFINVAEGVIEVTLDEEKVKILSLRKDALANSITKAIRGITVKVKEKLVVKPKGKETGLNELYRVREKVKLAYIKGVKGVTQVLPLRKGDEYVIVTAGSNLSDVCALPFVDETRTTTNNVHEVAQVLGIEAARQTIINEVYKVIESQGLNVDLRHIMLVADTMCAGSSVKGITRYGIVGQKASVLARASFETPIKHVINAALIGEIDELKSVVENVMLNQPVPIGTGLPSLVARKG